MSSRHARRISNPLPYLGKLTLSAGVITDDTRLAGAEGDGEVYPDSSVGVWPAATNYVLNGNCGTNTTNIDANAGTTLSRVTDRYKFGGTSLRVVCPGSVNTEGANFRTGAGTAAPGDTWSAAAWFYHEAAGNLNFYVQIAWRDSGGAALSATSGTTTSIAPYTWTRLTVTGTAPASTDRADVKVIKSSISTDTFWAGGVGNNKQAIAHPYIHTDGGTASRSAGRIQGPASVLDEMQFWIAARVRTGFAASAGTRVFVWLDDANNYIIADYASGNWRLRRKATSEDTHSVADTVAVGDYVTVIFAWTATTLEISVDGAAYTSTASTNIPVLAASSVDIGSQGGTTNHFGGDFKWVVEGRGTKPDPALVRAWGNNDPLPHMFPRSAQLTFLAHMNGDGTLYRYA